MAASFGVWKKMLQHSHDNLDALILEEKKRVAQEFFYEAWANAISEGVEPSILAESAVSTALSLLVEAEGEKSVDGIVAALPQRHECGHFLPNRSLQ